MWDRCITGRYEEMWRLSHNADCSRTSHISEHIDQWECTTYDTKAKARHYTIATAANNRITNEPIEKNDDILAYIRAIVIPTVNAWSANNS